MSKIPKSLSTRALSKSFAIDHTYLHILHNIHVQFDHGTSYALIGPSGSGKSTFLHLLAGLELPSSGSVYYDTHDIHGYTPSQQQTYRQRTIGLMFQRAYLIDELSVQENIVLAACIAGHTQTSAHEYATHLLSMVELTDKAHAFPRMLSGGQQQRVALARALVNKPTFLLADEPTGSLDQKTARDIIALIQTCQQEYGMGVIISTHDPHVYNRMDTQYLLYNKNLIPESSHAFTKINH